MKITKQQQRKNQKEYFKALNNTLDIIFKEADRLDISNVELSRRSKLCNQTIQNAANRYTQFPFFRTVWALAKAVEMDFVLSKITSYRKAM